MCGTINTKIIVKFYCLTSWLGFKLGDLTIHQIPKSNWNSRVARSSVLFSPGWMYLHYVASRSRRAVRGLVLSAGETGNTHGDRSACCTAQRRLLSLLSGNYTAKPHFSAKSRLLIKLSLNLFTVWKRRFVTSGTCSTQCLNGTRTFSC